MSECVITEKKVVDYIEGMKKQLEAAEQKALALMALLDVACDKAEEIRKERDAERAHNAVLRSALENIADMLLSYIDEPNNAVEMAIDTALDATQSDSAERVKAIVELLQDAVSETENGEKLSVGFCLAAREALNKWGV